MPLKAENDARAEAKTSLERMQKFDVDSLIREEDLGRNLNFREVVIDAKRLVDLYKRLSVGALDDFSSNILNKIKETANRDYTYFDQILKFSTDQGNPQAARTNMINQIINAYPGSFEILHPLVAYSLHRSADFQRLDREARSTFQAIKDKAEELTVKLESSVEQANKIVEEVRKVAAETGVSQQAIYFKEESESHNNEAMIWGSRTVTLAVLLGIYAVASMFIAKWTILKPEDVYQSVQLGVSKILIFAVISFMLYLSAKNFLSHKHNAIVNKHRQNALMTYKALVEAAKDTNNKEVVLIHASACIFGPQPTGYSHDVGAEAAKATSIIEVLGKPLSGGR